MISDYEFLIFFLGFGIGVGTTYLSKLWYKYRGIEYGPYIHTKEESQRPLG